MPAKTNFKLSLDDLSNLDANASADVAFRCLNQIQHFKPKDQVAGVAALLAAVLNRFDLHRVTQVVQIGENLLHRGAEDHPKLRAITEYAKHEFIE